MIKRNFVDIA